MDDLRCDTEVFKYYSSITEKSVEWLWYPYIPYGKISILQGDPGEGKSTLMLHIAALLTKGQPMPNELKPSSPENVVYQCSEDDIADTIKPRLIEAGADCEKVAYIVDDDGSLTLDDSRIETTIAKTGARLFIIDPIQSYLIQDGGMHNAGKMRSLLGKLSVVAAKYKCAIVLIGHMNKASSNKSLYRGLGSIDIAAIARSVLMICRDTEDTDNRYLVQIKSSLAPEGEPVGFRFDRERGFLWCNNNDRSKVELSHYDKKLYYKHNEVSDSIIVLLRNGPLPSAEIFARYNDINVSERTLYTIKKELRIHSFRENNVWYWKLPDTEVE